MAIDTAVKRRAAFGSRKTRAYQTPNNATSATDRYYVFAFYYETPTAGPKVEIGFGATWVTADASITWTDVSTYVHDPAKVTASRGRRSIQDRYDATDMALTLINKDRRFDTTYTAGPYYGQLLPGVPIRVTTTPSGQTSRAISRGFIKGFPQRYDIGNTLSVVPIEAHGVFDKLARAKLPQSVVDVEVLADDPSAYWKLDDNTETEMFDSSGNDEHGTYDNPELGQDPLVTDDGKAVYFAHVGDHRGKTYGTGTPVGFPATLEAWASFPSRDLTLTRRIMGVQRDTSYLSSLDLLIENTAGGSPNGEVVFNFRGLGSFWKRRGSTAVDDGLTHHVALSITDGSTITLYVDGVAETLTTISGTAGGNWAGHYWWVVGNLLDVKAGDYGAQGTVDNVAVYPSALSAARVLAHYNAGTLPWDGDTTDVRLGRILDVIGLPSDRRNFEVGKSMLGPTVLGQQRVLDYMRLVEASEDGALFETADGKIRFLDRYWRVTDSHSNTSQVTFSDASGIPYSDLAIDPDDELLVNICTVTREDAAALTVANQTSVNTYGSADTSIACLLQTDAEARSLGEHIVLVRGTPQPRVSALTIPLHKLTAAQQASILDLDIGYRITVARTPQGVGSAMSLALIVEGIKHTISAKEHWITLNVSVAYQTTFYFLWDTSTWDTNTTWGW